MSEGEAQKAYTKMKHEAIETSEHNKQVGKRPYYPVQ